MVNLGCGLDNTGRTCDNSRCKIYNLDFGCDCLAAAVTAPGIENKIPLRPERHQGLATDAPREFLPPVLFLTQQVGLVRGMADAFPGGAGLDAANRTAVKMIAKTWLKTAKSRMLGAYFAVSDAAKEIGTWDSRLQVTSRGYMLGYNDLRDSSVSCFFRFLARVGDNGMKMQIRK